jgi:hypothetical protein
MKRIRRLSKAKPAKGQLGGCRWCMALLGSETCVEKGKCVPTL